MLPVIRRAVGSLEPTRWFDHDLDRFLNGFWEGTDRSVTGVYPVDIREDDESIYVDAEVPGFAKDEMSVSIEKGILNITAERKAQETKGTQHLSERRYSRVRRSFTLSTAVDESQSLAKLDNGVLHLTLPKVAEAKPQKIEVN